MKKIILSLIFFSLFLGAKFACAGVVINEVKYSPTTKQWIEIYNDTNEDIDITTYKILDSGAATNGHNIVSTDNGSNIIPQNSFGIISKSPSDFSTVSFPVFKSSLNIKVSDDKVILKNDSEEVDSVNIDGSAIDGNSLQKISGSWVSATPTPGTENENNSSSENTDDEDNSTTKTTSEEKTKQPVIQNPTMKAKILANTLAFAGQPFEIKTSITGYFNENVVLGKAYWNFGDGGSLEQVNNFEKFHHTYYYPGEYVLILEYYSNNFSITPDVTSKMTVKVLPTTVTISKVGDAKDFFVELTNNATSDIDVSGWILRANNKVFVLPRNTVIMSKKQMTLSGKITGFTYEDRYILKLFSGTGELIFDYHNQFTPAKTNSQGTRVQNANVTNVSKENNTSPDLNLRNENNNSGIELASASTLSGINENENSNFKNSYFFFWGFVVLLIVSGGAVYYIRRGKNVSNVGDDFKIIDE